MFYKNKKFKGNLEAITNSYLVGWLADDQSQTIENEVHVSANGYDLGVINKFSYREDLEAAGIANGVAAFKLDLSTCIEELKGEITFSFVSMGKVVFEGKLWKPDDSLLNLHWNYKENDLHQLDSWSIDCHSRLGLRIARYSSSHQILERYDRYSRFSLSDTNNTNQEVFINIPLENITENLKLNTVSCCLIARGGRLNSLIIELYENDDLLATEPFELDTNWTKSSVQLIDHEVNLNSLNKYKLRIRYLHQGRDYFDIAFCGVGEGPDLFIPKSNSKTNVIKQDFVSSLNNGQLQDWSQGAVLSPTVRGMELADGWFFECRKGIESEIFINQESYYSTLDPLVFENPKKLLRVRTKNLAGYARIILPVDMRTFSADELLFMLNVSAQGLGKNTTIPKISLIARTFKTDHMLHNVASKIMVTDQLQLEFSISKYDLASIRKKIKDYSSVVLAIDLDSYTDISFKSIDLIQGAPSLAPSEIVLKPEVTQLAFEDQSIVQQLNIIKGLESWSDTVTMSTRIVTEIKNNLSSLLERLSAIKAAKVNGSSDLPQVDIIIPIFNAHDDVINCIVSIITKTTSNYHLILIDDCSAKATQKMLEELSNLYPHITLLRNATNKGYTKTVNIGLKASKSKWKIVLNSDTIVTNGWVEKLMACAFSQDNVGMVGALSNAASWQSVPEIFEGNGTGWNLNPLPEGLTEQDIADLLGQYSQCTYPQVGVINGFCQLINGDMLNEIGLLDEKAFPTGFGEENDMCARAVKANYKLLIADDVYIFHAKSKSFGHEQRKKLSTLGAEALKQKHPDVNWNNVTEKIKNNPDLNALRAKLLHGIDSKIKGSL